MIIKVLYLVYGMTKRKRLTRNFKRLQIGKKINRSFHAYLPDNPILKEIIIHCKCKLDSYVSRKG